MAKKNAQIWWFCAILLVPLHPKKRSMLWNHFSG